MLKLVVDQDDLPIIKRKKKSLLSRFHATQFKDLERAIELACYLVVSMKKGEARVFLKSFIPMQPIDGREDLWVVHANGVLLLAFISKDQGHLQEYNEYIKVLNEHDLWPTDIRRFNWIRMHVKDHNNIVKYALTETQKYRCEVFSQQFLSFLYFHEMLYQNGKPTVMERLYENKVTQYLKQCQSMLHEAVFAKTNPD